jgi:tetratricopeptide (TPR) repeat protein
MIFNSLKTRYQEVEHVPEMSRLRDAMALEVASCYWLGFGTTRDEAQAKMWFSKHAPNQGFFDYRLARLRETHHSGYLWWTKLSQQMSHGHLDFTNSMQYYRDQQQTQTILEFERRELEDWEEVLGPGHFIVSSRSSTLFEKFLNIGLRHEALALTQDRYDRCKAALSSDHAAFFHLRHSLVMAYLTEMRTTEARQYLFELHPELEDEKSRTKLFKSGSDAVFLRNSVSYVHLAVIEGNLNHFKKAQTIYRLVVPRACKLLGDRNLQCIRMQYDFAMLYHSRNKFPKALEILDPLYKVTVSNHGETHELSLLVAQRRFQVQSSMRLYRLTWAGRLASQHIQLWFDKKHIEAAQAQLGNDHPYTMSAIERGIDALLGTLKYEEAIKLAERAVDLVEKRSGKDSYEAEVQRRRLRGVQRTASLHNTFFTWGSWTFRTQEPRRFKGVPVWWKTRKFEPFELDLTLDPNYRIDHTSESS